MHFSIVKLVAILVASAFGAGLGIFRDAFRAGKDPSDDGPRALIAEFSVSGSVSFFSFRASP
jgi:hypothetical protein